MVFAFAFALDARDPNSMPVTRDLSPAKRAAIVAWLGQDPPPRGPTVTTGQTGGVGAADGVGGVTVPGDLAAKGGKTAAAARRRARQ